MLDVIHDIEGVTTCTGPRCMFCCVSIILLIIVYQFPRLVYGNKTVISLVAFLCDCFAYCNIAQYTPPAIIHYI